MPLTSCSPIALRKLRLCTAGLLASFAAAFAGPASAQVVISQVYTGATSAGGSTFPRDWVELHNTGTSAVSLSSYSLQYAGPSGTNWGKTDLTGTIEPGGFYLVSLSGGVSGAAQIPNANAFGTLSLGGPGGKIALLSTQILITSGPTGISCPLAGVTGVVDFVGYGTSNCSEGPTALAPAATASIARAAYGCQDSHNNRTDFVVRTTPVPRSKASPAQDCPVCGPGVALTTSPVALWQQFALACVPNTNANSVEAVLGGGTTGKLDSATYGARWSIWKRNPTNSGNVQMTLAENLSTDSGHWIRSLDAPAGGTLVVDRSQATATPVATGITGCQSIEGCFVVTVPTATAGSRMIANPLPYDIDWSKVRVRRGGGAGVILTPSAANAANVLSNTIWIYNGTSYSTWSDTAPTLGNLQYFKSFFVKVLPTGVGEAIELLIPALPSALPSSTVLAENTVAPGVTEAGTTVSRTGDTRESRAAWVVDLAVQNIDTGWQATSKLGYWPGTSAGTDASDLVAMAPFGQPYLTLVFPRGETRGSLVDYTTDFRPANGWAGTWNFEVRAQPLGSRVMLRWNAPAHVLAKSRLIDRETGAVVYPSDPNFAAGYPMTLDTPTRRLTWEYMGN